MKSIAFKISDQLAERLVKTYRKRNKGAQRAVESWGILQILTTMEIKSIFTEKELKFLLRFAENKKFFLPNAASNEIFTSEVCQYNKINDCPNILDFRKLIFKIKKLTTAQTLFLNDWLDRYWNVNKSKIERIGYIKFLAKEEE